MTNGFIFSSSPSPLAAKLARKKTPKMKGMAVPRTRVRWYSFPQWKGTKVPRFFIFVSELNNFDPSRASFCWVCLLNSWIQSPPEAGKEITRHQIITSKVIINISKWSKKETVPRAQPYCSPARVHSDVGRSNKFHHQQDKVQIIFLIFLTFFQAKIKDRI